MFVIIYTMPHLRWPNEFCFIVMARKHVLIIWVLMSLSTLYRLYLKGSFYGQRKPVHTVGQGSINC